MALAFADGSELNFYACSLKHIEPDLDAAYDWDADIMSPTWDAAKARKPVSTVSISLNGKSNTC